MKNSDCLVSVKNVFFSYANKKIYRNLSMEIPRGKITAILGPSGTGKTTILRLIGAQLTPDSGEIEFDGVKIHSLRRSALYEFRKRMSMLFQSGALFSDMTVFENVAFPLEEHTKLPEELIFDVVMMNLEAVGTVCTNFIDFTLVASHSQETEQASYQCNTSILHFLFFFRLNI